MSSQKSMSQHREKTWAEKVLETPCWNSKNLQKYIHSKNIQKYIQFIKDVE